jgi:RNA polymerase sigma-70 factor (ECF subfamily)
LRLQRKHESWTTVRHAPAPEAAHLDVVAAVRRLPAGQRRTLVLHDVVGLTGEEIAAELGVPAGTVRAWLHRGRQSVAKELGWSDPKAASAVGEAQSPKEETRDD